MHVLLAQMKDDGGPNGFFDKSSSVRVALLDRFSRNLGTSLAAELYSMVSYSRLCLLHKSFWSIVQKGRERGMAWHAYILATPIFSFWARPSVHSQCRLSSEKCRISWQMQLHLELVKAPAAGNLPDGGRTEEGAYFETSS